MSNEFVLFDLPGKQGKAWSPNTWKVRAVLNYKKLSYKTEWVEFPDIGVTMELLGIPPNPAGHFADYTVPVVQFPDGSYIMGADAIVEKLQTTISEPHLPLEPGIRQEMAPVNGKTLGPLIPMVMPRVRRNVAGVNERSDTWFKKDRERRFGAPEEVYEREKGGERAWKASEAGQRLMGEFLKKHKRDGGPFLLGNVVSYPDFVLAGVCEFFSCLGDDVYERLVNGVDGLRELHQACRPWFERNDH